MRQWEHTYVQGNTVELGPMKDAANQLGAEGWELVGITSVDRTIGMNTNLMVFKREVVPPPDPRSDEEWQVDPCGRFDKRRWDGRVWTAQVAMMDKKTRHVDSPTTIA